LSSCTIRVNNRLEMVGQMRLLMSKCMGEGCCAVGGWGGGGARQSQVDACERSTT
jgi:hypothetical protein